ncbi:myomodulin neuropeptides-like isoform X1 [Gigantopelta aegis]|uniref:myomodulin neuropeptides-like isoform X1 n=2 Tax=Gigantopelta aegis TaxID=1735272 RepID=UPI001B88B674|nr:myomodulin neuropeptides-like isoform X1 [Gigantopelta aegis]
MRIFSADTNMQRMVPRMFSLALFTLLSVSLLDHLSCGSPLESLESCPGGLCDKDALLGVEKNLADDDNFSDDLSGGVDKRLSKFVRIGKALSHFVRIGKSTDDDNEGLDSDLIEDDADEKRATNHFLRIGKSPNHFLRIGKSPNRFMRIGKGVSRFLRIGKSDEDDKRSASKFLRIGKSDSDFDDLQKRRNAFIRIGKIPSSAFVRIGREPLYAEMMKKPSSNFLRIGRGQSSFIRIGKRSVGLSNNIAV